VNRNLRQLRHLPLLRFSYAAANVEMLCDLSHQGIERNPV
jgi:hypothetical protein